MALLKWLFGGESASAAAAPAAHPPVVRAKVRVLPAPRRANVHVSVQAAIPAPAAAVPVPPASATAAVPAKEILTDEMHEVLNQYFKDYENEYPSVLRPLVVELMNDKNPYGIPWKRYVPIAESITVISCWIALSKLDTNDPKVCQFLANEVYPAAKQRNEDDANRRNEEEAIREKQKSAKKRDSMFDQMESMLYSPEFQLELARKEAENAQRAKEQRDADAAARSPATLAPAAQPQPAPAVCPKSKRDSDAETPKLKHAYTFAAYLRRDSDSESENDSESDSESPKQKRANTAAAAKPLSTLAPTARLQSHPVVPKDQGACSSTAAAPQGQESLVERIRHQ
jgi:hypothetical protein